MSESNIKEAVTILDQGGIVVFPTDTAFGIGCRIDNEQAISRLFSLRKRPNTQATPVLVDTVVMAQRFLEPIAQDVINNLIEQYWPGALTIVLPCIPSKVPQLVRGGSSTLGVRIPNHEVTRAIIRSLQIPILGPSANFHGEDTPYEFEKLDQNLLKLVDYVVYGECTVKQASTVVDCTDRPWKILRQGAVDLKNVL
jgi:L-threonylcarbamoyladenylate synthase